MSAAEVDYEIAPGWADEVRCAATHRSTPTCSGTAVCRVSYACSTRPNAFTLACERIMRHALWARELGLACSRCKATVGECWKVVPL